jgi:hypothetical protein
MHGNAVDRRAQDRQGVYFVSHVSFEDKFSLSSLTFLSLGSHSLSHVFIMNSRTLMSVHLPNQVSDEDSGGGAAAGAAAPPPEKKSFFFKKKTFF